MLETYHRGSTAPLKIDTRNAAGDLYDPDTSFTVSVYNSAGTAVLTDEVMTKESTGVYYYNLPTTGSFATGAYRVVYTIVNAGLTSKSSDFFILTDPAAPATGWSVITLTDQLRSEIDVNPDAAGGTIPDRLAKLVRQKGIWLFNHQDWLFRKQPATLTVPVGSADIAMPDDFKKLDGDQMRLNDTSPYTLLWTEDPSAWQRAKDLAGHSASNIPRVALVYYTGGAWKAKLWPANDTARTYDYWYLKANPWAGSSPIADNISLSPTYWPEDFDEGWYLLCAYTIYSRFRADDSWKGYKSEFTNWLKDHEAQNNETISSGLEPIRDVMGDFGATLRGLSGLELPGGRVKWYGST